jgi:predicted ATP-binding protein involved in virulence
MDAQDSRQLARWQFRVDPAARKVLFVPPPRGLTAERAQDLLFDPNLIVVVRDGAEPARLVQREQFTLPHILWEISPSLFEAVQRGQTAAPAGFDGGPWEDVPRPSGVEATRITRLLLKNYRCFEAREVSFGPGFNVLIGRNGAGKTAVLDAVAELLRHAVRALSGLESTTLLSKEDVRVAAFQRGEIPVEEPQTPAEIDASLWMFGDDLGTEYGFQVIAGHGSLWHGTGRPISFLNVLDFVRLSVQSGYDVPLPVLAYYRTGRAWAPSAANGTPIDERSRLAGFSDWDQPAVNMRPLEHWWSRMELLRAQRGVSLGVLEAVKNTVLRSLGAEEYEDVRYDAALQALAAKRRGGPWLPFRRLSDGVRNMLGMVADLAVRCARLNPHFGVDAPQKTSGIALIDELDLHLHPAWQRRIVDDLRSAFPLVQFLTTTHSPSILQSLHDGRLIGLDGDPPEHPADKSIEDILEVVMGIEKPQKSRRWHAMVEAARAYQQALEGAREASPEQKEALKTELDRLLEPYRDNPAYVAFLQLKRTASGLDAEGEAS